MKLSAVTVIASNCVVETYAGSVENSKESEQSKTFYYELIKRKTWCYFFLQRNFTYVSELLEDILLQHIYPILTSPGFPGQDWDNESIEKVDNEQSLEFLITPTHVFSFIVFYFIVTSGIHEPKKRSFLYPTVWSQAEVILRSRTALPHLL